MDTYTDYVEIKNVKETKEGLSDTSIQMFVTLSMLSWIREYTQEVKEIITLSEEKSNKLSLLKDVNLVSSKTFKDIQREKDDIDRHNKKIQEIHEGVNFLSECFKRFGNGVRLITYKDFYTLILKYNLYLAPMSGYIGEIPDKNLQDVVKANKVLKSINDYDILGRNIKDVFYHNHNVSDQQYYSHSIFNFEAYRIGKIFIAAPLHEIDYLKLDNDIEPWLLERKKEHSEWEEIRTMDPLACSYTDYGVLIYTAWGEEADDAIFDKYEELNNAIRGLEKKAVSNDNNDSVLKSINTFSDKNAEEKAITFICCFISIFVLSFSFKSMIYDLGGIELYSIWVGLVTAVCSLISYLVYDSIVNKEE